MDRERQTLELLQLLGDEVADAVLSRLQPERAAKLRASLKTPAAVRSTISRQREVLDEFECFFQFALKSLPPEPKEETPETTPADSTAVTSPSVSADEPKAETAVVSVSPDTGNPAESTPATSESTAGDSTAYSTDAASASSAPTGTSDSVDSTDNTDSMTTPEETMAATTAPALTGNPLEDLKQLSAHQISQALASEQSRTSAILLSRLPASLAGEILNLLKGDYQKAVMKELTKQQVAPDVLVERIARATFQRAQQLSPEPPDTRTHSDRVAEVLRSVPKAGRKNMLAAIEEQDPELAKSLLTKIYRFEDIAALSKTMMQRVLGEIDSTNLTTALYGAPQDVTEAVFSNLSKRARQTIEEEMQFMSGVQESRILQARNSIAEIIARIDMESEG
ncbi:MAG: FliG C-terminal domain-containing protein [Planctomycetaceae bacterium]